MHFKLSLVFPFICFLVVSCSFVPGELKTAEQIMDAHPDSALSILKHLKPENYKENSELALYDLLLFQALDKNGKTLPSSLLIDFSTNYFLSINDKKHLAYCYYYKGHSLKYAQRYDEATAFYFKALESVDFKHDYLLLGKIYSDKGDICVMQQDYKESLKRYWTSLSFFSLADKKIDQRFVILSIGRSYHLLKDYKTAQLFYRKALSQVKDSMLCGSVYQEMGINYYSAKQFDSAQFYLRKSLPYPFKGTSFAIRCYKLSDLLFDLGQYDASFQYATLALKQHPANFYTQRDCYRILVNIEYLRKNINQMGFYMTSYQSCTDSIRQVELQTKSTVLEKLHATTQESNGAKSSMIMAVSILMIILLVSVFLVVYLYKRNKLKREQLDAFKIQLSSKQEFVSQALTKKIEETRALQAELRKTASAEERERLDRELYKNALHLNNWDDFNREMNHAFNNIIISLKSNYPTINQKELTWCCFHLLDIPHPDRMLLLEATSDSLYKLKQRLAQKLNLNTTKDLDLFLRNLTEI